MRQDKVDLWNRLVVDGGCAGRCHVWLWPYIKGFEGDAGLLQEYYRQCDIYRQDLKQYNEDSEWRLKTAVYIKKRLNNPNYSKENNAITAANIFVMEAEE